MSDQTGIPLSTYVPQVKGQIKLRKINSPYLGSVRFFRHIILGVVSIMIIAPWFFVGYLAGRGEARLVEMNMLQGQLIHTVSELQSIIGEYEKLVDQKNQSEAEKLALIDDLRRAEAQYIFESANLQVHPELVVQGPYEYVDSTGTVYLTFDDGPGVNTKAVLDILKRYNIKATFFIVGYMVNTPAREDLLIRIVEEGHAIGVHTYSHVYKDVYESLDAFLDDFALTSARIEEVTGVKPDIFRFPGGSLNSHNERWGNTIISEMLSRGYRYYDWNTGSGDTGENADADSIYDAVISQVHGNPYSVVLMHDGGGSRPRTVEALPEIIDRLLREGYRFDRLTNQVKPTVYETAMFNRG
ncbi:MAG: polysaccharide deacetylase [Peptococcaceae bacterium]|jgi:peptidoglycan/xylan/chitin deacetylase (PgdA/CDA1 family)|nr:polysaccharide deacetylase [Peptococcaceae bacterium]